MQVSQYGSLHFFEYVINEYLFASQIQYALRPHVEEKVEDAQVGQEAVFAFKDLIVAARCEIDVGKRMFGRDGLTEVNDAGRRETGGRQKGGSGRRRRQRRCRADIFRRKADVGPDVQQLAHTAADGHIEIVEALPVLFEEGADVVGIVFEERCLAVSAHKGVPMEMTPVAVVADTYTAF